MLMNAPWDSGWSPGRNPDEIPMESRLEAVGNPGRNPDGIPIGGGGESRQESRLGFRQESRLEPRLGFRQESRLADTLAGSPHEVIQNVYRIGLVTRAGARRQVHGRSARRFRFSQKGRPCGRRIAANRTTEPGLDRVSSGLDSMGCRMGRV